MAITANPAAIASGTRSEIAAETASSIAASAKPDSNRVTSSSESSPERSPRATASARPYRRCLRRRSIGRSSDAMSAVSAAAAAPLSRNASPTSRRASNASRRNGECSRARATASSRAFVAKESSAQLIDCISDGLRASGGNFREPWVVCNGDEVSKRRGLGAGTQLHGSTDHPGGCPADSCGNHGRAPSRLRGCGLRTVRPRLRRASAQAELTARMTTAVPAAWRHMPTRDRG